MRGAGVKARAQQLPSGQRAHAVSRVMTVWLAHEEDSGGVWPHLQAVKWSLQAFREVMRLTRREFPLSKVVLMETLEYLLRLAQRGDGRRCTQWALQCLFHDVPKRNPNFDNIFCIETPRENKHGPLSSSIIPRTHWRGLHPTAHKPLLCVASCNTLSITVWLDGENVIKQRIWCVKCLKLWEVLCLWFGEISSNRSQCLLWMAPAPFPKLSFCYSSNELNSVFSWQGIWISEP